MVKIEPFELYSVITGTLRLDGGAMFGVVPKVLWEKVADVDGLNRIALAARTLLAVDRGHKRVILVDTGCGTKWESKQAARYAIRHDASAVEKALAAIGLSVRDVTDVVVTHLHFDHNGGLTRWYDQPGGRTELCYPAARHWIHRDHWSHANEPFGKDRASFIPADFTALEAADVLNFVEGAEPAPTIDGVAWLVSHGHTPSQLHPVFGDGPRRLVFAGDLVPTVAHLRPGWVMAYDVAPVETMREKERIYRRCLDKGLMLAFPHDPQVGGATIDGTVDRPIVTQAIDL